MAKAVIIFDSDGIVRREVYPDSDDRARPYLYVETGQRAVVIDRAMSATDRAFFLAMLGVRYL